MFAALFKNKVGLILGFVFLLFLVWWAFINFTPTNSFKDRDLFADTYAIVALIGGVFGIRLASTKWGGRKSIMGKVIISLSLGLLAQVFGQLSYALYARILGVEALYPSLGDLGFYGSMLLYIIGSFYLVRICAGFIKSWNFNHIKTYPIIIILPLLLLAVSYLIFIRGYAFDAESTLVNIMNFAAPLLQSFYISLALVAFYFSKNITNSVMHKKILFLILALFSQYLADFIFLYKAHRGIYQTAGLTDMVYLIAYFLMSLSIINLDDAFKQIKTARKTILDKI